MDEKYLDIYCLKSNLWNYLADECRQKKSSDWTMEELELVLSWLKPNKSRDPLGIINDLFKPN